jgi:ubiquinone/menaquinone biosynthesis C-methylase UbiE
MKKKYYDWHKNFKWNMDIIEPFLNCKSILDVGCGTGWVGSAIKEYNKQAFIVGLDIDKIGLKLNNDEAVILGDSKKLPLKNNTFDGVIAKDILEHTLDPLFMMNEFNRVLKPGGVMYISVPHVNSKTFWDDYTHVKPYTKESITHLIEDSDLSIEKFWYTGSFKGLGLLMDIFNKKKLPELIKFFIKIGLIKKANIVIICRKINNIGV